MYQDSKLRFLNVFERFGFQVTTYENSNRPLEHTPGTQNTNMIQDFLTINRWLRVFLVCWSFLRNYQECQVTSPCTLNHLSAGPSGIHGVRFVPRLRKFTTYGPPNRGAEKDKEVQSSAPKNLTKQTQGAGCFFLSRINGGRKAEIFSPASLGN